MVVSWLLLALGLAAAARFEGIAPDAGLQ